MSSTIIAAQRRRSLPARHQVSLCPLSHCVFPPQARSNQHPKSAAADRSHLARRPKPNPCQTHERRGAGFAPRGAESRNAPTPTEHRLERLSDERRDGRQAIQRHCRRIHVRHHCSGYCALASSNRAGDHCADSRRTTVEPVRRCQRRGDRGRSARVSAPSRPPIPFSLSTAAGSTTSTCRAWTSRPFRAIRSSASRSPGATAAPCSTATTHRRRYQYRHQDRRRRPAGRHATPKPASAPSTSAWRSVSTAANSGPWSTSFYGNAIKSDGYRVNNALDQRNGVGNLNYTTPDLTAFLTLSGDDQKLGFPGGRLVDPSIGINQLVTNRQGAATPFDYGNQQGANATAGFTKTLWNGAELIVDGGVRNKKQQSGFFGTVPIPSFAQAMSIRHLQTWSLTPRLSIKNLVFGVPSAVLTGVDYYDAIYHSDRSEFNGFSPIHVYDLSQQTLAGYWQQTIGLLPTTDFSYGAPDPEHQPDCERSLRPDGAGSLLYRRPIPAGQQRNPICAASWFRHRLNEVFSVFGRAARAFRTPTVDERVSSGPAFDAFFNPIPGNFTLKTQTSHDVEGGFRVKAGMFQMQSSIYNMDLENEIHFDPAIFLQRQSRSDPPLWLREQRVAARKRYRTVARRLGLYPGGLSRRPFRRQ